MAAKHGLVASNGEKDVVFYGFEFEEKYLVLIWTLRKEQNPPPLKNEDAGLYLQKLLTIMKELVKNISDKYC